MASKLQTLFSACALLYFFPGCTSNEIGNSKDVNPDAIYRSYSISYNDGDDYVRCYCQFRFGGKNGTTLVLSSPANIMLDGEKLKVDSGKLTGAYYGADKPVAGFTGEHTLLYTDITGNCFLQKLTFTPFTLTGKIPAEINAADLPLNFTGLKDGDIIRVEIADTSSTTEDIFETDTVLNNRVIIKGSELATLAAGPLDMSFYADNNYPLDNPGKEGGVLNFFYKLKYQRATLKK